MKHRTGYLNSIVSLALLLGITSFASAQDKTEVYGFFEAYRNFDYKTGSEGYPSIQDARMNGGGGGIAYQYAPWFALWTQVSFFGTADGDEFSARLINNLQGVRYQTKNYGPFSFYGKGGLGFTNYNIAIKASGSEYGFTKFSVGYAGGLHRWVTENLGLMLEAQHLIMGVPNLTDADGRDKWDSGLSYKTGLAFRF